MDTDCVFCEIETETVEYNVDERHSSNQKLGFNTGSVHVRYMVDTITL